MPTIPRPRSLDPGLPLMREDAASALREALRVLRSQDDETDLLYRAARALCMIVDAAGQPRSDLVPQSDVEDVMQELEALFLVLEHEIAGAIPVEQLSFQLAMAVKLVSFFGKSPVDITVGPELVADILDYALLLGAHLQALALKRRINARGTPVLRSYRLIRAVAAAEHLSALPN